MENEEEIKNALLKGLRQFQSIHDISQDTMSIFLKDCLEKFEKEIDLKN